MTRRISVARIALAMFIALIMLVGMQAATPAYAANITVSGLCTLAEAITAANTDTATANCPAGSGTDTIDLTDNVELTTVDNSTDGENGLPSITDDVIIMGNGYTIERNNTDETFRIFHITSGNALTLNDVTVRFGLSDEDPYAGGGVYLQSDSFLTLTNGAHVDENTVYHAGPNGSAAGGGIYSEQSSTILIEEGSSVNDNDVYLELASELICYGGGISIATDSVLTVNDSEVSYNYCGSVDGEEGPGFITDIHTAYGGGIASNGGDVIIRDGSHVDENTAYSYNQPAWGGGIYSFAGGTVEVLDKSTVNKNEAEALVGGPAPAQWNVYGGGIAVIEGGELTVDNSSVNENVAALQNGDGFGAGIFSTESETIIQHGSTVDYNYFAVEYENGNLAPAALPRRTALQNGTVRGFGGGIYNEFALLLVNSSRVDNNWALDLGGGIANVYGYTAVDHESSVNCNLAGIVPPVDWTDDCDAPWFSVILRRPAAGVNQQPFPISLAAGGGIFNAGGVRDRATSLQEPEYGLLVDHDSTVEDNVASAVAEAFGGGIANGLPSYYNYPFITTQPDDVKVKESSVSDNLAIAWNVTTSNGGGLFNGDEGTMWVERTTVDGNTSAQGNGGGAYNLGWLYLVESAVTNNTAFADFFFNGFGNGFGGGLFNDQGWGYTVAVNSTFSGNEAGMGGGIFNTMYLGNPGKVATHAVTAQDNGAYGVELFNVTVTDNTLSEQQVPPFRPHGQPAPIARAAGVQDYTLSNNNTIYMENTIVADQADGKDCSGNIVSGGYNLDSDGTCDLGETGDQPNTNPGLGPLNPNGGPTQTHALLEGSPAIDKADPGGCTDPFDSTLDNDQRDALRPVNGSPGGVSRCDIGAFEAQKPGEGGPDFTIDVEPISIDGSTINWTVEVCNIGDAPAFNANVRIDVEDNQTPISTNPAGLLDQQTFWVEIDLNVNDCFKIGVVTEIKATASLTADGAYAKLTDTHAKAERRQGQDGPFCISGSIANVSDRDCISQTTLFPTTLPATGGQPVGVRGGLLLAIIGASVVSLLAGALLLFRKRFA